MTEGRFCPECGHANQPGAKFCSQCATPLPAPLWSGPAGGDDQAAPAPTPEPAAAAAAPPPAPDGGRRLAPFVFAGVLLAALVAVAIVLAVTSGGDDDESGARAAATQTQTETETTETEEALPPVEEDDPADDLDDAPADDDEDYTEEDDQPDQEVAQVGESAVDDDVTFKVQSLEPVGSIATDEFSDGPITPKPGAKLVKAVVTWKNNMNVPADIWCGGGPAVLLDEDDRNFQPMDNYLDITGNEICGEDLQPGFKRTVTLAFQLPKTAKTSALVLWNSDAEDDPSGDETQVIFLK